MSTHDDDGPLVELYRHRIGDPDSIDEVRGYWLYLLGLIFGTAGVALYAWSVSTSTMPTTMLREPSFVLLAIGFVMVLAGPIIQLPLARWTVYVTSVGLATCFVAVVWFVALYPNGWAAGGNQSVIFIYLAGLALIASAGIGGSIVGRPEPSPSHSRE